MDFHFLAALFWEKSVRWTVFGGRQVNAAEKVSSFIFLLNTCTRVILFCKEVK